MAFSRLVLPASLLVALVTVTGCGDDASDTTSDTTTTTTTTTNAGGAGGGTGGAATGGAGGGTGGAATGGAGGGTGGAGTGGAATGGAGGGTGGAATGGAGGGTGGAGTGGAATGGAGGGTGGAGTGGAGGSSTVTTTVEPACDGKVVISAVYGGGGFDDAGFKNDFVELSNRGTTTVSLEGWSIQYAAATPTAWSVTLLTGSIAPGGHYLVALASGNKGATLPKADATGTLNLGVKGGNVALVDSKTALTKDVCPAMGKMKDFVGWGTATCHEGTGAAPAHINTTTTLRIDGGCTDTDDNKADFKAEAATPRNSESGTQDCSCQ
jgi:hypothetical protein